MAVEKLMPSSESSASDDDEMRVGGNRGGQPDSVEDKVVEKSPKGRFHRVRSNFGNHSNIIRSSIVGSEVAPIKRSIWHLIMILVGKLRGMSSHSLISVVLSVRGLMVRYQ